MRLVALLGSLALAAAGCASGGATPRPFPGASAPPGSTARPSPTVRPGGEGALVVTALEYMGAPYRNGGTDPSGFDCSGFVHYVFGRHGVEMPRLVRDQFRTGARVDRSRLRPGDLVFFTTVAPGASHVGIVVNDEGEFVHAPSTRGVVRVERLDSGYWSRRFVGARRIS